MSSITTGLTELLGAVQRPGDFYAAGLIEVFASSLEVEGLAPAAEQADCDLHLVLVSIEESGSAEYTDYYGSPRRRWSDEGGGGFEIGEVYDQTTTPSEWRLPDGSPPELGDFPFEETELCPPQGLELQGHRARPRACGGLDLVRWLRSGLGDRPARSVLYPDLHKNRTSYDRRTQQRQKDLAEATRLEAAPN